MNRREFMRSFSALVLPTTTAEDTFDFFLPNRSYVAGFQCPAKSGKLIVHAERLFYLYGVYIPVDKEGQVFIFHENMLTEIDAIISSEISWSLQIRPDLPFELHFRGPEHFMFAIGVQAQCAGTQ